MSDKLEELLSSEWWRLNNLYTIVNKRASRVIFKFNSAQQELYENHHYCNIILKARQLGISTYCVIYLLDKCLWHSNVAAGVIAQTREDAEQLFRRVKVAYDALPQWMKDRRTATADSARQLIFSNGSSISVGTSMRGSTLQYLHISEFGKICRQYPEKAREIVTGSLNTLAPGSTVFIESTAEGREGYFYDMCQEAMKIKDKEIPLTPLDFKFHFFPWWSEPSYRIGSPVQITQDNYDYFIALKSQGIELDNEQKYWYSAKCISQKEDIKREFPSTPEESFEQSTEGAYYAKYIRAARLEKRICHVPYDKTLPVHTAWDLGYNDSTAIWLFQVYGKEVRLIEYIEGHGESLAHWLNLLKEKKYTYDIHLAPHDIKAHEYTTGMTRQASAAKLGFRLVAVPRVEVIQGIDMCRDLFNRCWFDEVKCEKGIKALENYKKEWDDSYGCWSRKPLHDANSHGSDAFRTLSTGLHIITGRRTLEQQERAYLEGLKDKSGVLPGSIFYEGPQEKFRSRF